MKSIAGVLIPSGRMVLMYSDMLLDGIDAKKFARMPEGITTNSPAFCFGHLAIYTENMLGMIGHDELKIDCSAYEELFQYGKDCVDDPDGTVYPPMDEIMARFRDRHEVVLATLEGVDDDVLRAAMPKGGMGDIMPTVGAMLGFLLGGHAMTHLGQVSAWRRIMGMGQAFKA